MSVPPSIDPLKTDFRNFLALVWEYLNLPTPTPVQYDIARFLQHGPRRRVVQAFRGVGKSWITVAFVCWILYCNPQTKVLVASASKNLSDNFSTFCLQLITNIPELQHLRPRDDQRNAKIQFDVGPAEPSKDPSVRSVGITGQITGGRADLIVADDIEVPNNSATQQMRDKLSESVKEFDAVLKPGGDVLYLGTPQTEQSIYNQLADRGYLVRVWPARFPAINHQYGTTLAPLIQKWLESKEKGSAGDSTDPDRFSNQDLLEREHSYGRSGFSLQFMLDTRMADADRYPLKLADLVVMDLNPENAPEKVIWASSPELCWKDLNNVGFSGDRMYRPMQVQGLWEPYTGSVLAIDPSGRGKDETGYCVCKFLGGQLFVTAWGGLPGGYKEDNLIFLAELAKSQHVNKLLIENNFGDGMFSSLLKPYLTRIYPVGIEDDKDRLAEIRHSSQKEKRIIDSLEPVMNRHKLIIDRKVVEQDWKSVQGLPGEVMNKYMGLYQLTRITRDKGSLSHEDRLDALAMAVAYWTQQMSKDVDKAMTDTKDLRLEAALKVFKGNLTYTGSNKTVLNLGLNTPLGYDKPNWL